MINGRTVGKTPFSRRRFEAGELKIELRYPLHLPLRRTVPLARGGAVELSLELRRSASR